MVPHLAAAEAYQRRILNRFRAANATAQGQSKTLDELQLESGLMFRKLVGHGVIREESPGRYWLDEEAWAELRRQRIRFVVMIAIPVLVGLLALFLFTNR